MGAGLAVVAPSCHAQRPKVAPRGGASRGRASPVAPDHRTGLFWIVFCDFTDGLAKGVVLVVLLSRIPRRATDGLENEEITSRRES